MFKFLKNLKKQHDDNLKALGRLGDLDSGAFWYTDTESETQKKEKLQAKKKSVVKKKSAVKKKAILRQKKEINRKLSEGLITERTATILMNRANADEKMRLIIENQRKEKMGKSKTKPKKPTSASTKEFEYVEKLKEIKSLREEGVITLAEFGKLKKKIIDSL